MHVKPGPLVVHVIQQLLKCAIISGHIQDMASREGLTFVQTDSHGDKILVTIRTALASELVEEQQNAR